MKVDKKVMIITGAGLIIGLGEALLYYNLGRNAKKEKFQFGVPKGRELTKTMGVVLVTSILTAVLSNQIEKAVERSAANALSMA